MDKKKRPSDPDIGPKGRRCPYVDETLGRAATSLSTLLNPFWGLLLYCSPTFCQAERDTTMLAVPSVAMSFSHYSCLCYTGTRA